MQPYFANELITIYHGDARDVVPDVRNFECVFTSPPYNKGLRGDHRSGWVGVINRSASGHRFRDGYGNASSDALAWPEYFELVHNVLGQCWDLLPPTGAMFVNHKPRVWMNRFWDPMAVLPPAVVLRQIIIWSRGGAIDVSERGYASAHEWLMFCPRSEMKIPMSSSGRGDVWEIGFERENNGHPAPFPVELPKRALVDIPSKSTVLDPFMGTGSTLRAAADLGMKAIGIEIEERWCEVAAGRMAQQALAI